MVLTGYSQGTRWVLIGCSQGIPTALQPPPPPLAAKLLKCVRKGTMQYSQGTRRCPQAVYRTVLCVPTSVRGFRSHGVLLCIAPPDVLVLCERISWRRILLTMLTVYSTGYSLGAGSCDSLYQVKPTVSKPRVTYSSLVFALFSPVPANVLDTRIHPRTLTGTRAGKQTHAYTLRCVNCTATRFRSTRAIPLVIPLRTNPQVQQLVLPPVLPPSTPSSPTE
jgi:hypothetical protein